MSAPMFQYAIKILVTAVLVVPSLVLFIALPLLLKAGLGFWLCLAASCACTALAYVGMVRLLAQFGIRA